MKKLLLIDSLGLLYRGHYALISHPLTAPDGTVTSGINFLATEIFSMYDRYSPDRLAAVFDYPAPSFRKSIYPDYKANRPPMPDELRLQSGLVRELLPLLGIPVVEREGLEADDLIASLSLKALEEGMEVIIISSDKDMLQLLQPGVVVLKPGIRGRPGREITDENVIEEIGVRADQVIDYLALTGDSSDNVPGARGIGPKTAKQLIEEYDNLDSIYRSIDTISSESVRNKLIDSRELVDLSRTLVTLDSNLPKGISLATLRLTLPSTVEALEMLEQLGMQSLYRRFAPEQDKVDIDTFVITDEAQLDSIESSLRPCAVAIDTETTSLQPMDAEIVGISITNSPDMAWYLPMSGKDKLERGAVVKLLKRLSAERGLVAQNAKYDLHILSNLGIEWGSVEGDPFIADYLLRPVAASRSISTLSSHYIGRSMTNYDDVLGGNETLLTVPTGKVAEYCCADAATAWRLHELLALKLRADSDLNRIYTEVELPLIRVLTSMERRGVRLDLESLNRLKLSFSGLLHELASEANRMTGYQINLDSPRQVSNALFSVFGLKPVRKTAKGVLSSSMTVLEALRGQHPFVDLMIEYRELSKLLNTYVSKLPGYISPVTGLVHTSFNQAVTATGRLSSSAPNLQNIPIRTTRGKLVRSCFVPSRESEVFVSADYSQIELRVLAHLAGPGALRDAYENDMDIHNATSEALFGDCSPEHRSKAKEVNFSIVYGISPFGLASRLGVSRGEASGIINRYFATYPEVDAFYQRTVSDAESTAETRTILGRKRDFPDLAGSKGNVRRSIERMVVNTTVQGSAADVVKLAMLKVHERLREELPDSGLVLQVHDELLISCTDEDSEQASAILKKEMETAFELAVPLRVELGKGRNWLEAQH
jgi:DNA polymerase-1